MALSDSASSSATNAARADALTLTLLSPTIGSLASTSTLPQQSRAISASRTDGPRTKSLPTGLAPARQSLIPL